MVDFEMASSALTRALVSDRACEYPPLQAREFSLCTRVAMEEDCESDESTDNDIDDPTDDSRTVLRVSPGHTVTFLDVVPATGPFDTTLTFPVKWEVETPAGTYIVYYEIRVSSVMAVGPLDDTLPSVVFRRLLDMTPKSMQPCGYRPVGNLLICGRDGVTLPFGIVEMILGLINS